MKATILQANFAKALSQVSRIISTRSTLPVLGNVLITAKKGKISFSATDLEVGISTQVAGKVEEEGELTVPARLLSDFILNNSDDTIEVTTNETKMHLKSEHYEANISGISAEEFPTVPDAPKELFCSINRVDFVDAVKKVIIAPANDETRPTIAGVFLNFDGKSLTLVATDSYRLAEKKLDLPEIVAERKIIVPTRTMAEVLRLLGSIETDNISIAATDNQIFFIIGEVKVVSRIIEGAYPNYRQIIPTDFKIRVVANYKEYQSAIKMAALFAKDAANNIRVKTADKNLVISSALAQTGDATSNVPAEIVGGEVQVAFNARYILDVLPVMSGEKISLHLNDSTTAGLIASEADKDFIYIVMPLKIDE